MMESSATSSSGVQCLNSICGVNSCPSAATGIGVYSGPPKKQGPGSCVCFRESRYCWRIQSQPRKLFTFGRMKHISFLFGGFANSIHPTESSLTIFLT